MGDQSELQRCVQKQLSTEVCRAAALGTLVEGNGTLLSERVVAIVSEGGDLSGCALFVFKFLGAKPKIDTVFSLDAVSAVCGEFQIKGVDSAETFGLVTAGPARPLSPPEPPDSVLVLLTDLGEKMQLVFPSNVSFMLLLKEINHGLYTGSKLDIATDFTWLKAHRERIQKRVSLPVMQAGTHPSSAFDSQGANGAVATGDLIDIGNGLSSSNETKDAFGADVTWPWSNVITPTTDGHVPIIYPTDLLENKPTRQGRSATSISQLPLAETEFVQRSRTAVSVLEPSSGDSEFVQRSRTSASATQALSTQMASGSTADNASLRGDDVANAEHLEVDGRARLARPHSPGSGASPKGFLRQHVPKKFGKGSSPLLGRRSKAVASGGGGSSSTVPNYSRTSVLGLRMLQREAQYTQKESFRVFCGTWNVNGQLPSEGLQPWLGMDSDPPDIYAVGFQELDLSAEALLLNDSSREEAWERSVDLGLNKKARYAKVRLIRLVGMLLIVYIQEKHRPYVQNVEAEYAGTGLMGMLGNKGGVAVRMQFHNTFICFVNCHLAAHAEQVDRRNQDYHEILSKIGFSDGKTLTEHSIVFWMGDLNYRLNPTETIDNAVMRDMATEGHYEDLKELDQLASERIGQRVFGGFLEGNITFKPTYKYDPGTDNWDTSEKCRPPAWCDRILWNGLDIEQLCYRSHPVMKISDHKPVSAIFFIKAKVIVAEKHRAVFDEVSREMDRLENNQIPVAQLSVTELQFKNVKYREEQVQTLEVTNAGQVPMQFSFIPKLQEADYCKCWMRIQPSMGCVYPGKKMIVSMTVLVDTDSVAALNSGGERLEDILILHLDGGKDYFVSISGNFVVTCFGKSLDELAGMTRFVREIPTAALIQVGDVDGGAVARPPNLAALTQKPFRIPKELWWLVDYLSRSGKLSENLFSESGTRQEFADLREQLDTGEDKFHGSAHAAAEGLLLLLEALPEPVIPFSLYQRCIECSNQYLLCRQLLGKLPPVHHHVFNYITKFLKELLLYEQQNKLDAKMLATVFATVLIRPPLEVAQKLAGRKRNQSHAKRAAAFVYHFLIDR